MFVPTSAEFVAAVRPVPFGTMRSVDSYALMPMLLPADEKYETPAAVTSSIALPMIVSP